MCRYEGGVVLLAELSSIFSYMGHNHMVRTMIWVFFKVGRWQFNDKPIKKRKACIRREKMCINVCATLRGVVIFFYFSNNMFTAQSSTDGWLVE